MYIHANYKMTAYIFTHTYEHFLFLHAIAHLKTKRFSLLQGYLFHFNILRFVMSNASLKPCPLWCGHSAWPTLEMYKRYTWSFLAI